VREKEIPDFTLKRIRKFTGHEGIPESKYIHVLGTNGKGETVVFLERILLNAGYKVGSFVSPHVFTENERCRINGKAVARKIWSDSLKYIESKIKTTKVPLTYFEKTLSVSLNIFKTFRPDFVILEAGLGGRLDATNIFKPILTIFTPISIDHTEYLGNTIEKIAKEKAAAIKKKSLVITNNDGAVFKVINRVSKQQKASLFKVKKHIKIRYFKKIVKVMFKDRNYSFIKNRLKFKTSFQKENFEIALSSFCLLFYKNFIELPNTVNLLKNLEIKNFYGRFEVFSIGKRRIIVDSAHNVLGAKVVLKEIRSKKGNVLIVAMLKDKDIENFLRTLGKKFDIIIFSENSSFRKEKAIEEFCRFISCVPAHAAFKGKIIVMPDLKRAIREVLTYYRGDVLITGSFYTSLIAIKELRRYESRI